MKFEGRSEKIFILRYKANTIAVIENTCRRVGKHLKYCSDEHSGVCRKNLVSGAAKPDSLISIACSQLDVKRFDDIDQLLRIFSR